MTAPSPLASSLPLHINWRLGCAPPPSTITLGAFGVPHTMELNVSADPVRWMLWILGCLNRTHKCGRLWIVACLKGTHKSGLSISHQI